MYSYREIDNGNNWKKNEVIIIISSSERTSGTISNFNINDINGVYENVYRVDLISFSYPRIPNLSHLGIKIKNIRNETENRNDIQFYINNNCNVQNLDGIDIVSGCDLVNTYSQLYEDRYETFNDWNMEFVNPITLQSINMLGDSTWVFRLRMVKKNEKMNIT